MSRYRYVQSWVNKAGRVRTYFRRRGYPRIALPTIGSPEFVLAYSAALNAERTVPISKLSGGVRHSGSQPLIGVYLLLLRGRIVYIGSSMRMPERVAEHRTNGRPFDQQFYIATTAREREALERVLIRAINPSQNRQGRCLQTNDPAAVNPIMRQGQA